MGRPAREIREGLPDGLLGYYDHDRGVVVISLHVEGAERRCTEMHEQIHAERGDYQLDDPWHDRKQERRVEREAARRLISFDNLMDALAWCCDLDEVAEELQVDMDTLLTRIECLGTEDRRLINERMNEVGRCIA